MKAVWKISGEFFGWISESGSFFNSQGKRHGTFQNNTLYNHNGKYSGELVNDIFIGYYSGRRFLHGPECYLDGEVYLEPLLPKDPLSGSIYIDPK
jgi:hypothetical protein